MATKPKLVTLRSDIGSQFIQPLSYEDRYA